MAARMHPFTLTFEDVGLERAYQDDLFERYQRRQTPAVYAMILIATISLALLDYLVIPDAFAEAVKLRFGVVVPIELVFFALIPTRHFQRMYTAILLVPMLAGWWLFLRLGALAEPPGSYLYIAWPAIFTLTMPLALQFTTRRSSIAIASVVALYLVMEVTLLHSPPPVLAYMLFAYSSVSVLGVWTARSADQNRRTVFLQRRELEAEQAVSEGLLRNMLPGAVAERLKRQPGVIADSFDDVTVLFADIVGFTAMSERIPPSEVVRRLNELFSAFDAMARRHGLEKIKTIGDAYMVVGGLPERRSDHAAAVAAMALEIHDWAARTELRLRIGVHTGPVVAGVIGTAKYSYDLWGDTVNTASRMEAHGVPEKIHVTEACRAALGDGWTFVERGVVDIKGKGPMRTYWLTGRAPSDGPRQNRS